MCKEGGEILLLLVIISSVDRWNLSQSSASHFRIQVAVNIQKQLEFPSLGDMAVEQGSNLRSVGRRCHGLAPPTPGLAKGGESRYVM